MSLPKSACCLGAILIFAFMALVLLIALPKKEQNLSITHSFGIGFDLSPSYATVAVSYPNGSIQKLPEFRIWRDTRQKICLPSSGNVGTLSNMIYALRARAKSYVGEPVSAATISIPHLAALYTEDLRDAFEYLSLFYLEIYPYFNDRSIPVSLASYAGNGLGLYEDYRDDAACTEEESHIPSLFALTVGYTHSSLTTSQARLSSAYYIKEIPALENLRLGYDARHEESYWEAVRHMLQSPVVDSHVPRNISMVILFGDATEMPRFREVLGGMIDDVLGDQVQIVDQQPEFSAAKGVAELAKRAIFKHGHVQDISSEL
ncbi:hypothetical protein F5Y19DRAFT_487986 [Xylariaceae sp. FL1651]|nr:hypothetical protein F5Y19DRAFT_487986 [Xylariaceae sp. FL1651]